LRVELSPPSQRLFRNPLYLFNFSVRIWQSGTKKGGGCDSC
jgi:hypothetical protein